MTTNFMLLHGLPGHGDQWNKVARHLTGCTVTMPTFAGFETGHETVAFPSTEIHAGQIVDWAARVPADDLTIVAWSFACHPLLFALTEMGLHARRVVFVEPSSDTYLDGDRKQRFLRSAEEVFTPVFTSMAQGAPFDLVEAVFRATGDEHSWTALGEDQKALFRQSEGALRCAFTSGASPTAFAKERLAGTEVGDVDIVVTTQTRDMFRAAAEGLGELLPQARVHTIEGANHMWPILQPAAFAEFLQALND